MGICLEARDLLSEKDWVDLRKEAMDDLLNEKGPRKPHFISDLVDARAALLGRRYAEALSLLDRAICEIKQSQ